MKTLRMRRSLRIVAALLDSSLEFILPLATRRQCYPNYTAQQHTAALPNHTEMGKTSSRLEVSPSTQKPAMDPTVSKSPLAHCGDGATFAHVLWVLLSLAHFKFSVQCW